ncbi:hypothetical protein CFOL_v3_12893 [Cephalotus follicularis]|uniref:Protein FLX-like 4 n=1 Tax=Cephalotus follicularis TaxID=3775 RepID=A0A1Q3BNG0_CEPFO|nr:hypothetical protein CFOL_v3_12893 [Cephalotus follicularis]
MLSAVGRMAARRQIPPLYEGRSVQVPGMMRHGPFPGLSPPAGHDPFKPLPPPELLENKIAAQASEMKRLTVDNNRLADSHVSLREDLISAQQETQRLKAHIRSIQTESDIQIRGLLDKIAKKEADIRAGENVKKDLQQSLMEAQSLVKARLELTNQIQQASQELQKEIADVKSLPSMHAELDSLRKEHQRLRATFEYEKGSNIEQVKQLQAMEKNLMGMAREVEKLRADVLNAKNRACEPILYDSGYINPDPAYLHSVQGGGAYVDEFGRPLVHMSVGEGMVPYSSGHTVAAPAGLGGAAPNAGTGPAVWGGP